MRALVTGCAGFIGSHLTERLLREGYQVVGIDCFTDYYPREIKERNLAGALNHRNLQFMEKDLLDMDEYPEVDYVFHLAAQAGVRASWGRNFEIYTRNNVLATQKLLEFYKARNLTKFVYASSSSVYGDAELPMRENSALKPVSPYGVTKLAGENLCYLYFKSYGVPVVSLRYFTVYGPRQRPDMAIHKFTRAILDSEKITVFGDGNQLRDFTFVDDAVAATVLAAKSDITGEAFNIGEGSRVTVNEVISLLENILGRKAKVEHSAREKGDVQDTWADVSKARAQLHWQPATEIRVGLEKFVEWTKIAWV